MNNDFFQFMFETIGAKIKKVFIIIAKGLFNIENVKQDICTLSQSAHQLPIRRLKPVMR
jgi:hypothetical protein